VHFWGPRNFCNRWTLVTCRVDSNWTSQGLGLGLGDIKVNEISKKINWSVQNKLVNKNGSLKELWLVRIFYQNKIDEKLKYFWSTLSPLRRKNIEWNWQVIILQNIETQTFKYTLFIFIYVRHIYTGNCNQNKHDYNHNLLQLWIWVF
jgi:hypothetical protein